MPALLIPQYSLYCGSSSNTVDDAHLLMRSAYYYWYHKGFWGALSASLVDLANALILSITALLLTMCFRWDQASTCVEAECSVPSLFSTFHSPYIYKPTASGRFVGVVLLVSTAAGAVYEAMHAVATFHVQSQLDAMAREMDIDVGFRTPYHRLCHQWRRAYVRHDGYRVTEGLLHSKPALSTMGWSDFLEQLCGYVTRERKLRFCANGSSWDAMRAVQTLLWEDNLMVALQELGVLEDGAVQYLDVRTVRALLPALFDPFHSVVVDHSDGGGCARAARSLHLRAIRYAQCYLVLYAFVVVFFLLKVLAKNAARLKQSLTALKQYQWNSRARWTFRLYNEVEHVLNCRLEAAEGQAVNMVNRLSIRTTLSRLVRRASSTCVLTVAALSLLNPSLLVMGTFLGVSFVWWLSMSLLLFASFPKADSRAREYDYIPDLDALTDSLHHDEPEWRRSGDAFLRHVTYVFFDSVFVALMKEVLCILGTPFVLFAAARDGSLTRLCEAVSFCCATVDGVGSVPRGAMFDASPESEEDENAVDDSMERRGSFQMEVDDGGQFPPRQWYAQRSRNREKVQLSAASFMAVYEQWTLRHVGLADASSMAEDGPTTLTREMLERWRSTFREETQDSARHLSDEDSEPRSSSSRSDSAASASITSGSSVPAHHGAQPFSARIDTSRSGRQLNTARSHASAFPPHSSRTAHDREHYFVSTVRRRDRVYDGEPRSAAQTSRANGTYGAAQSAHHDAREYSSASS